MPHILYHPLPLTSSRMMPHHTIDFSSHQNRKKFPPETTRTRRNPITLILETLGYYTLVPYYPEKVAAEKHCLEGKIHHAADD